MDDLISRREAINRINKQREHLQPDIYPQDKIGDVTYRICAEFIARLPSAQPEIIRCKDCKHWREGTAFSYCDKLYGMGVLDALDYMVAEDDYCSMAERRTDEE